MTVWSPESTADGTTTNTFATALSIDTRVAHDTTVVVANTDASNALDYEVLGYSNYATGQSHTITTGTLTHGDTAEVVLVRHSKIVVRVKSSVGGSHATYQVDSILGR